MDYMTLKEAGQKWNVTPRQVNYLCSGGRIPGAVKMAGVWLIPKNAESRLTEGQNKGRSCTMNRILLLEDDVSLIDGLVYSLKNE